MGMNWGDGVVMFFVLKFPDYKVIFIYLYIKADDVGRSKIDFHEIRMVGAGPLVGEPYRFWKQSAQ